MKAVNFSLLFAGIAVVLALVFLFFCSGSEQYQVVENVQLVSLIVRHGDRTPTDTYPTDPYKDYPWPEGWSALTKIGKNQMYNLGQRLKKIYGKLLPDKYSPDDIYVRSSDADRCHMSAAVFLAGMYPPIGQQIWNENLLWQPIPIHSLPRNLDETLGMKRPCVKYDRELEKAYKSKEIQEIDQQNADLYKYVSEHAGKNFSTITDIEFFHTTLEIEEQYGLKLPDWTNQIYPNRTLPLMMRSLAIFSYSPFMRRIRGGSFLKEVINNMILKRDGKLTPNRNVFLYSAHDITLVHIFRTLGFEELIKPAYGATLAFELHQMIDNKDTEVQLKYFNTSTQHVPVVLEIPKCSAPCGLNTFVQLLAPVIPANFDEECDN